MNKDDDALRAELDNLIARAGLAVSDQRRQDLLPTYADLKKQLKTLSGPHDPHLEPSTVFRLPLVKGRS